MLVRHIRQVVGGKILSEGLYDEDVYQAHEKKYFKLFTEFPTEPWEYGNWVKLVKEYEKWFKDNKIKE